MREREQYIDPYWQQDLAIGEGQIRNEPATIRLRLHTNDERYREDETLIPLPHKRGHRTYFHARPYILVPEMTMTFGLYPKPSSEGAMGEIVSSDWEGMRHQEIGNAQAWYYHPDRVLILWECYLYDLFRQQDPLQDESLKALWSGFERLLLERVPEAQRIITPNWEDIYGLSLWQEFLRTQGYGPLNERAFVKEVET